MILNLILSIILTSHAQGIPICKTLGFSFADGEPRVQVEKQEKGFIVKAFDSKKVTIGKWSIKTYYDLNLNEKLDYQTYYFSDVKTIGPFNTIEVATQKACDEYYSAKFYLLKKYMLVEPIKPKNKFVPSFNIGMPEEISKLTFNQNVSCRPKSPNLELGNWQYDQGVAFILEYKGNYYAYDILSETNYDLMSLLQLRGPYKSAEDAGQIACELRYNYFSKKRDQFKEPKKNLSWQDLCKASPIKFTKESPFLEQYPRVGSIETEREILFKLDQVREINKWLANYLELTTKERREKIQPELMLPIEQILAQKNKKIILDLKNLELKLNKVKEIKDIPVKLILKIESWKMVLDPKNGDYSKLTFKTEWPTLPFVDQSNLGELKIISHDEALKKFCELFKNEFVL